MMRKLNLVCSLIGSMALLSSCASQDGKESQPPQNVREEVRAEPSADEGSGGQAAAEAAKGEARMAESKAKEDSIVERIRKRFRGCDLEVVAKSPHAEGNPCMTSAQFMKDEGLSEEQVARVNRFAEQLQDREMRTAH